MLQQIIINFPIMIRYYWSRSSAAAHMRRTSALRVPQTVLSIVRPFLLFYDPAN